MTTQTTADNNQDRALRPSPPGDSPVHPADRRPLVYGALVLFSWLYYYRPEDFIPGLSYIPMAKIAGIIGIVALIFAMLSSGKVKIPRAVLFLWLLLFQMTLCIPFALWRGGAFSTVTDKFSKGVVVAMLISMCVVSVRELRKLLWIQVSAITLVVFFSIAVNHVRDGRLEGIQKSILENPNDLAINIAISFPLGVAFMLRARGFKKAIWAAGLAVLAVGVVLTYSRSGLLAFIISVLVCMWEYGIKGKRKYLIGVAAAIFLTGLIVVAASSHYRARVESIVMGNIEGSGDKGSLDARKELLKKSIKTALTHPLFGVGPGCFVLVDKGWIVAHNSYTELAAEEGLPALALFLLAIGAAFKNVAQVRRSQLYEQDPEVRLFTQALWAGLAAYVMGACFASTEYNLYPYFMVGYTCAMVRITSYLPRADGRGSNDRGLIRAPYERTPGPQPVWSR
ncbi:MAG TPA: O-antigen ligase family protein [Candidatus Dormibacteraeota bacterium]|nr:O-antigen ligase family protein [Candidatus Dormibacteraeota bacterium]